MIIIIPHEQLDGEVPASIPIPEAISDQPLHPDGELVLPATFVYFRENRPDAEADRTMTFAEVAELGGRLVPKAMKMETADKPGEFTLIRYKKIRFDIDIPGKKFTERALRQ